MLALFYIRVRWVRLTTRRYGWRALFTEYRPKRAGIGHGIRTNFFGRQHGWGTPALYLVRQMQLERMMGLEEGPTVKLAAA